MTSVLPLHGSYAKLRGALLPFSESDPFIFHVLTTVPFRRGKRPLSVEERRAFLPRLIAAGARITPKKVRNRIWLQRRLWATEMPAASSGELYEVDSLAGDDELLFFTAETPYSTSGPALAFQLSTLRATGKVGVRSHDLFSAYKHMLKRLGGKRGRAPFPADSGFLLREFARRATFSDPGQVELILRERAKSAFTLASAESHQHRRKLEGAEMERLTRTFAPLLDAQQERLRPFAPLLEKFHDYGWLFKMVAQPGGPVEVVLAPNDERGVRLTSSTFFHPWMKWEKNPVFDWTLTKFVKEDPGALAGLSMKGLI